MKNSEILKFIDGLIIAFARTHNKNDILAAILSYLMQVLNIEKNEYMIVAGYSLQCIKKVTDLDVGLSNRAFQVLKNSKLGIEAISKISKTPRIYLNIPKIDQEALEFFALEDFGFPTKEFSLPNLQKNNRLIRDKFGNPYFDILTAIDFYSEGRIENQEYKYGQFTIDLKRLKKNISHLHKLYSHLQKCKNKKTPRCACLTNNYSLDPDSVLPYLKKKLKLLHKSYQKLDQN